MSVKDYAAKHPAAWKSFCLNATRAEVEIATRSTFGEFLILWGRVRARKFNEWEEYAEVKGWSAADPYSV